MNFFRSKNYVLLFISSISIIFLSGCGKNGEDGLLSSKSCKSLDFSVQKISFQNGSNGDNMNLDLSSGSISVQTGTGSTCSGTLSNSDISELEAYLQSVEACGTGSSLINVTLSAGQNSFGMEKVDANSVSMSGTGTTGFLADLDTIKTDNSSGSGCTGGGLTLPF